MVSINLQEMGAGEQLVALQENRIQVGFLRPPVQQPGLAMTRFMREPLVAVLPAEHPLAARKRIPLRALANDPFIIVPRSQALGGLDLVLGACFRAGFSPNIAQEALELQSVICECMISESVPDTLRGDATRFVQVLNNLLGRKYGRRCSA